MLFGQDLVGKSCSIGHGVYRFCLNYRRAAIQLFGNKVHRGAGLSPASSARWWVLKPGYFGSSEG